MKVFISWSGTQSRAVAEALHWWLPKVLQQVKPFVSAKDIDKGANWTVELARELEEADFGVVCLTPDNLSSPWLHYETGAIARSVDSRVCPLLHGVEKEQVAAPLGQLQLTDLGDVSDMLLMMTSMNTATGHGLGVEDLRETVEMWWPRLRERLDKVSVPVVPAATTDTAEPDQPTSTDRELLMEVLEVVRGLSGRIAPPVPLEQDRVLTPQEQQARDARRSLLKALRASGITARNTLLGRNSTWIYVVDGDLPEPLPAEIRAMVSNAAKDNSVTIRLKARAEDGRTVEFDQSGWSSEPPMSSR